MSTSLKERIEELGDRAEKLKKVLEKHPHAYLATIEHGREVWVAASVKGTAFEFTSDSRYPGRSASISVHPYEEIEGVRIYEPPGCGRTAEYIFDEMRKKDPDFYKALMEKVFR